MGRPQCARQPGQDDGARRPGGDGRCCPAMVGRLVARRMAACPLATCPAFAVPGGPVDPRGEGAGMGAAACTGQRRSRHMPGLPCDAACRRAPPRPHDRDSCSTSPEPSRGGACQRARQPPAPAGSAAGAPGCPRPGASRSRAGPPDCRAFAGPRGPATRCSEPEAKRRGGVPADRRRGDGPRPDPGPGRRPRSGRSRPRAAGHQAPGLASPIVPQTPNPPASAVSGACPVCRRRRQRAGRRGQAAASAAPRRTRTARRGCCDAPVDGRAVARASGRRGRRCLQGATVWRSGRDLDPQEQTAGRPGPISWP